MKTKNRIILQIIIFSTFIGLLFAVSKASIILKNFTEFDNSIKTNIEQYSREDARYQLANIRNIALTDIANGTLNVNDKINMQEWAKKNIACLLNGGPTGDAFMIELGSEQFIWDGSPDCSKSEFITNGRYMKDEAIMHQDFKQAEKTLDLMRLGLDTKLGDNYWWQFDDSKEWLEWIVIPVDKYGFDGQTYTVGGIKNNNYKKLIIVLGTQSDEAFSQYNKSVQQVDNMKFDLYLSLGCMIFFDILFIFYLMHCMTKRSE